MNQPKSQQSIQVAIVYTYRYFWKNNAGKLFVKYLTESQEGHRTFQQSIIDNPDVVSCAREYVNEINFSYLGFSEPVKQEKTNKTEV